MTKILSLTRPIQIEEKPVNRVWMCICENTKFYIHEDQSIECSECGTYSNNVKAFWEENAKGPSKGPLDK